MQIVKKKDATGARIRRDSVNNGWAALACGDDLHDPFQGIAVQFENGLNQVQRRLPRSDVRKCLDLFHQVFDLFVFHGFP